jgi:hypothetical protein
MFATEPSIHDVKTGNRGVSDCLPFSELVIDDRFILGLQQKIPLRLEEFTEEARNQRLSSKPHVFSLLWCHLWDLGMEV